MSRRNRRDKRQPIPRRKACRFESGPGHHGYTAMVLIATCASFRQPFPQNGYFGRDFRLERIGRHGLKKQVKQGKIGHGHRRHFLD